MLIRIRIISSPRVAPHTEIIPRTSSYTLDSFLHHDGSHLDTSQDWTKIDNCEIHIHVGTVTSVPIPCVLIFQNVDC